LALRQSLAADRSGDCASTGAANSTSTAHRQGVLEERRTSTRWLQLKQVNGDRFCGPPPVTQLSAR
jgi:hypothetical protein